MLRFSGYIGHNLMTIFKYWIDLSAFCQASIGSWLIGGKAINRGNIQSLITQTIFTGITATPLVLALALTTAFVLTSQVINLSNEISRDINVIQHLSHIICFELAPFFTAFILISRSGTAITVDIGNMKLRGEIDGLTLLAIDINDYIIAPRILAGAISQLVLAVYFSVIALYGGIFISSIINSKSHLLLIDDALGSLSPPIISLFIIKNLLFGITVCGTACFQALQMENCATQLPEHTKKAIIRSMSIIFLLDLFFAVLVL